MAELALLPNSNRRERVIVGAIVTDEDARWRRDLPAQFGKRRQDDAALVVDRDDDIEPQRHAILLTHDLVRKPVATFRDHALVHDVRVLEISPHVHHGFSIEVGVRIGGMRRA